MPFPTKTFSQPEAKLRVKFDALNRTTMHKTSKFFGCFLNRSTTSSTVPRPALSLLRRHTGLDADSSLLPHRERAAGAAGAAANASPQNPNPRFRRQASATCWPHTMRATRLPSASAQRDGSPAAAPSRDGSRSWSVGPAATTGKREARGASQRGGPVGAAAHRVAALPAAAAG